MKKVCRNCFTIYDEYYVGEFCPIHDCDDGELIEIDDMMIDIVVKFWRLGVDTISCCSGHLYGKNFNSYLLIGDIDIGIDEFDLDEFKILLEKELTNRESVEFEDIIRRGKRHSLAISTKEFGDLPPELRIERQADFLFYLYEVAEQLEMFVSDCNEDCCPSQEN